MPDTEKQSDSNNNNSNNTSTTTTSSSSPANTKRTVLPARGKDGEMKSSSMANYKQQKRLNKKSSKSKLGITATI
jgi:hypothetical protein